MLIFCPTFNFIQITVFLLLRNKLLENRILSLSSYLIGNTSSSCKNIGNRIVFTRVPSRFPVLIFADTIIPALLVEVLVNPWQMRQAILRDNRHATLRRLLIRKIFDREQSRLIFIFYMVDVLNVCVRSFHKMTQQLCFSVRLN